MSITLDYVRDKGFLYITVDGEFVLDELNAAFVEMTRSDEYPPDVDAIWDLRKADFVSANQNLWRNIIECRKKYIERANCKSAMVVCGDFPFGMGRMYQMLAEQDVPQEIIIFKSLSEAEQYIAPSRPQE